jgi:hypothetical protein
LNDPHPLPIFSFEKTEYGGAGGDAAWVILCQILLRKLNLCVPPKMIFYGRIYAYPAIIHKIHDRIAVIGGYAKPDEHH